MSSYARCIVHEPAQLDERLLVVLHVQPEHGARRHASRRARSTTRRSAADCCPRMSPPCGLGRVERRRAGGRRASPGSPTKASAIASGTVGLRIMFACTDQPGPMRAPACATHASPVCATARPGPVDHRDLARRPARVGRDAARRSASPRRLAFAHPLEPERAVAQLGERLGRDRADAGFDPRHDGTDREEVRLHGDAERAASRDLAPRRSRSPAHPPGSPREAQRVARRC